MAMGSTPRRRGDAEEIALGPGSLRLRDSAVHSFFAGCFVALCLPAVFPDTLPAAPGETWRVGTAKVEITPPLEVGILMSSGRQAWAPFEGVRTPARRQAGPRGRPGD